MTDSQPWRLTASELLQVRLLDWANEERATRTSDRHMLSNFVQASEADRAAVEQGARALASRDLVRLDTRGGMVAGFQLTQLGVADIDARQERRSDHGRRRRSCRDAFLHWLGHQPESDPLVDGIRTTGFVDSEFAYYEGEPFTDLDVATATTDLQQRGLITGVDMVEEIGGLITAKLVAQGWDCLDTFDGSVSRWSAAQSGGGAPTFNQNIGNNYGMAGSGQQVEQTQNQGIDLETLVALLQRVRDDAQQVSGEVAEDVAIYVDEIEAEASNPSPNVEGIQRRTGRLQQIASRAGNAALTSSVGQVVAWAGKGLLGL